MRKSDKKKNMVKANLLAEQKYLKSKGLLNENVFHADGINEEPMLESRTSQYDLSNEEVWYGFTRELVDVISKYLGQTPNDAGITNDNRMIMHQKLSDWISRSYPNTGMAVKDLRSQNIGIDSGIGIWTYKPELMGPYAKEKQIHHQYLLNPETGEPYEESVEPNDIDLNEGGEQFPVYHETYGSAIDAIETYANSRGLELDQDEYRMAYQDGFFKPKPGDTKSDSISIIKDGKPQRKMMNVQIYGMGSGKFELNMYVN